MFPARCGRISDSRLSKRASGDSNLTSSLPSTIDSACRGGNERGTCVDEAAGLFAAVVELEPQLADIRPRLVPHLAGARKQRASRELAP
jgi:hypothetical protein